MGIEAAPLRGTGAPMPKAGMGPDFQFCSNPDGLVASVRNKVKDSPFFQRSIDHGQHVVEFHAARGAEASTVVTFIYEKTQSGSSGILSAPMKPK